jgi:hypothetical protein
MSKDKVDFEFTLEDLQRMVIQAMRGEGQNQPKKPIAIEALKAKAGLNKEKSGTKS